MSSYGITTFALKPLLGSDHVWLAISFPLWAGVFFGLGVIAVLLWRIRRGGIAAFKKGIAIFLSKIKIGW